MKKFLKLGTALAVAAGVSTVAYAQMKPEDAIRARQSIMRVVALNWGPIAGMAQDKIPFNKDVFVANAVRLEAVWAMNPTRFFVPGSEHGVAGSKIGSFTDAKGEVWSQSDKFKAAYDKEAQEIGKLAAAARSGDEKAMKAAAGDVGKGCGACHDDFRAK